tara:strand:- start:347 stop:733 length:387 start_codon:yes stop_codon:yes gene_type:complete
MAITIEHSTRFGDYYETAYARIVKLEINYAFNYAEANIGIYRSEDDRASGKEPVLIEKRRYLGDEFENFFKELALDNIDATINPVADIYDTLTKEEGKYKGGIKAYDEKEKDGVVKEVSKDEKLRIEL